MAASSTSAYLKIVKTLWKRWSCHTVDCQNSAKIRQVSAKGCQRASDSQKSDKKLPELYQRTARSLPGPCQRTANTFIKFLDTARRPAEGRSICTITTTTYAIPIAAILTLTSASDPRKSVVVSDEYPTVSSAFFHFSSSSQILTSFSAP